MQRWKGARTLAVRLRRVGENLRQNDFSLRRVVALFGLIVGFFGVMVWILPDFSFREPLLRNLLSVWSWVTAVMFVAMLAKWTNPFTRILAGMSLWVMGAMLWYSFATFTQTPPAPLLPQSLGLARWVFLVVQLLIVITWFLSWTGIAGLEVFNRFKEESARSEFKSG